MKVSDHMSAEHIYLDASVTSKSEVLDFVAQVFVEMGVATDKEQLHTCMVEREKIMSTGIGKGIGIPHAACNVVSKPAVVLLRPAAPLDYDALDTQPVDVIIAMVVPGQKRSIHLRLLAGISRLCKKMEFLSAVREAKDPGDLFSTIRSIENSMAFH